VEARGTKDHGEAGLRGTLSLRHATKVPESHVGKLPS
jgi:hypothetical protein